MILKGAIRESSAALPPSGDVEMVRGEDEVFEWQARNLGAGRSVVQLIDTGNVVANPADGAENVYQKNLTLTSDLATDGQITDDGETSRVASGTVQFLGSETLDWPDVVYRQLWAVLDTGAKKCIYTGRITMTAPIPVTLPLSPDATTTPVTVIIT